MTISSAAPAFAGIYLRESITILEQLAASSASDIDRMAAALAAVRDSGGRLFILGVGGGAGHASHAVCDFRKIAQFEAYAPSDNVSELTARTNDEGWNSVYEAWLRGSRLSGADALLVFSVGGGDRDRNISANLVAALDLAADRGSVIAAVVGRDGGHAGRVAQHRVVVPTVASERITPHTESMQALVWHLLVSHPLLAKAQTKWESAVK